MTTTTRNNRLSGETSRPCFECKDRYPGCHSTCTQYKNTLDDIARKKAYLKPSEIDNFLADKVRRVTNRKMRWQKYHTKGS